VNAVKQSRPTRRERAAQTRERMLEAATQVFVERGYAGARMADIAEHGGVAIQTLYYTFSTKSDLLRACVARAVLGPDGVPPPEQPFWAEMVDASSGREALAAFARGNVSILARAAEIDEVQKAAIHEPEAAELAAHSEGLRRETQGDAVARLAERFGLRAGLDNKAATDLFVVLCGTEVYLGLKRSGWADEQYVEWLTDTLADQLLA
jgi:AcrR family transcriptional regulator